MTTVSIPLHNRKRPNLCATIDEEDLPIIAPYTWSATLRQQRPGSKLSESFYANGTRPMPDNVGTHHVLMHVLLMRPPHGLEVDHINLDSLDNRRLNLRIGTRSQNMANARRRPNNTSGYNGVGWHAEKGKWRAYIRSDGGGQRFLGYFDDPEEAARVRDIAARVVFGEFALLNFPD